MSAEGPILLMRSLTMSAPLPPTVVEVQLHFILKVPGTKRSLRRGTSRSRCRSFPLEWPSLGKPPPCPQVLKGTIHLCILHEKRRHKWMTVEWMKAQWWGGKKRSNNFPDGFFFFLSAPSPDSPLHQLFKCLDFYGLQVGDEASGTDSRAGFTLA